MGIVGASTWGKGRGEVVDFRYIVSSSSSNKIHYRALLWSLSTADWHWQILPITILPQIMQRHTYFVANTLKCSHRRQTLIRNTGAIQFNHRINSQQLNLNKYRLRRRYWCEYMYLLSIFPAAFLCVKRLWWVPSRLMVCTLLSMFRQAKCIFKCLKRFLIPMKNDARGGGGAAKWWMPQHIEEGARMTAGKQCLKPPHTRHFLGLWMT